MSVNGDNTKQEVTETSVLIDILRELQIIRELLAEGMEVDVETEDSEDV